MSHEQWWAGTLKRPLLHFTIKGCDAGRPEPTQPNYGSVPRFGASVSAEEIVDRWDYNLSRERYLGDAFPNVLPNFGPGVVGAFLGAEVGCDDSTVWFHPKEDQEVDELNFAFDPENPWLKRAMDVVQTASKRWEGMVQVNMTDLGGNLDVLSTFRPSENLLLDLYDKPEAVKARTWELHDLWWKYFGLLSDACKPYNPGYSAWAGIFSSVPYYMLQSDFCYMISTEMFDEFVKPELAATCSLIANPFYHLDGPGQLAHLDSLLTIPELKGVQWMPTAGSPRMDHYPEIYRKIRAAGKRIQVYNTEADSDIGIIDVLAEQLGSAEGIIVIASIRPDQEAEALDLIEKYAAN